MLHSIVTVTDTLEEVNGRLRLGTPPKTDAGVRTVTLSAFLVRELAFHLDRWAEAGPGGLVFPAPEGGPLRRSNFRRRVWVPATEAVGLDGLRFHDYADLRVMPTLVDVA
jgi:hypothetical protein